MVAPYITVTFAIPALEKKAKTLDSIAGCQADKLLLGNLNRTLKRSHYASPFLQATPFNSVGGVNRKKRDKENDREGCVHLNATSSYDRCDSDKVGS